MTTPSPLKTGIDKDRNRKEATERDVEASASDHAAVGLASIGSYLREGKFDQLAEELTGMVQTHPGRAIALAVMGGFLGGATLSRGTLLRLAASTFALPALTSAWGTLTARAGRVAEPSH